MSLMPVKVCYYCLLECITTPLSAQQTRSKQLLGMELAWAELSQNSFCLTFGNVGSKI